MLQREDGAGLHHPAPLLEGVLRVAIVVLLGRFKFPAPKAFPSRRSGLGEPRMLRLLGRQRRRPGGARHQRQDGRLSPLDEVGPEPLKVQCDGIPESEVNQAVFE